MKCPKLDKKSGQVIHDVANRSLGNPDRVPFHGIYNPARIHLVPISDHLAEAIITGKFLINAERLIMHSLGRD